MKHKFKSNYYLNPTGLIFGWVFLFNLAEKFLKMNIAQLIKTFSNPKQFSLFATPISQQAIEVTVYQNGKKLETKEIPINKMVKITDLMGKKDE